MSGLVLIVDDDPVSLAMVASALSAAGFATVEVAGGQAAIEAAARTPPDVILMDAVMPGLDGFEACRRLKTNPNLAERPIIFMTGLSETQHVVEGFKAGGVDYVTKPLALDELVARIHVHLANARMAMSARRALDAVGRALLTTDADGEILWRTSQAAALLPDTAPPPPEIKAALRALAATPPDANVPPALVRSGERMLQILYLGGTSGERFIRLSEPVEGREDDILREALSLTRREADVLVWIARGKPNRDISEILNISARTVNKHLEQIFIKLGVETRAAAAAMATRIIATA